MYPISAFLRLFRKKGARAFSFRWASRWGRASDRFWSSVSGTAFRAARTSLWWG